MPTPSKSTSPLATTAYGLSIDICRGTEAPITPGDGFECMPPSEVSVASSWPAHPCLGLSLSITDSVPGFVQAMDPQPGDEWSKTMQAMRPRQAASVPFLALVRDGWQAVTRNPWEATAWLAGIGVLLVLLLHGYTRQEITTLLSPLVGLGGAVAAAGFYTQWKAGWGGRER